MSVDRDPEDNLKAIAAKLRVALDGFELHGDGEHHATLADLARISTALTTTCAEIRQAKKATIREVGKIPLDTILTYLKSLSFEQRDAIARELTGADAEEPLL